MATRPLRGSTQEDVRLHNLRAVLTELHLRGPLRRADLTERIRLNRSTIGGLVAELVEAGLAREESAGAAAGKGAGRPSPVVAPEPERVQVLAVSAATDRIELALVGLGGTVLCRRARPLHERRAATVAASVGAQVRELVAAAPGSGVVAVSVAVPGLVRHSDGCVRLAPNFGWVDEPFGALLQEQVEGLPVWVGNDADLGALAEHRRGVARAVDDVVFLAGETGVGGGVIVGGRPLSGAGGYAGEVGHVPIRRDGRQCRCGARGCWETEIGTAAIARALGRSERLGVADLVPILHGLGSGHRELDGVGRYLGRGIATLANVLNPQMVIVGGVLREVYPLVAEVVARELADNALAAVVQQLQIAVPGLAGDAALVGAAELGWDALLAEPGTLLERRAASRPPG